MPGAAGAADAHRPVPRRLRRHPRGTARVRRRPRRSAAGLRRLLPRCLRCLRAAGWRRRRRRPRRCDRGAAQLPCRTTHARCAPLLHDDIGGRGHPPVLRDTVNISIRTLQHWASLLPQLEMQRQVAQDCRYLWVSGDMVTVSWLCPQPHRAMHVHCSISTSPVAHARVPSQAHRITSN